MVAGARTAAEWLTEARRWLAEGVCDAALECGQNALAQSPGDPEIVFLLGRVAADLDRPAVARAYFEQVVAEDPAWNGGAARIALLRIHEHLKAAEDAWFECQKSPSAETFFSSAIWLRRLGQLDEALSSLDAAASTGWDLADVFEERADVHMELGDLEAAIDGFGKALEIDPNRADAWYGRAAALRRRGDYGEALRSAERSLQLAPTAAARWLRDAVLDALGPAGR